MELVEKATKHIQENAATVVPTYRCVHHLEPTIGWMNDPNGLIFLDGKFHLFYQSNPYSAKNENMAWGHFISPDLVRYEEVEVALYPNGKDETGCFTGSAFLEDEKLKLVYTRHLDLPGGGIKEEQYLCTTEDCRRFVPGDKPCCDISELPEELDRSDFRDPQIFYRDGICYLLVGGHTKEGKGVFIVYAGKNSADLHYSFYFGPYPNTAMMVECPSFVRVDDKDVVIYSCYGLDRKPGAMLMRHDVYYLFGEFLPGEKSFRVEGEGRIDMGDSFYAPKTIENYETPTMIGWMENWRDSYRTALFGHGYVGTFSFPRVLSIKNGLLPQSIHPNLSAYLGRQKKIEEKGTVRFRSYSAFSYKNDFLLTLRGQNGRFKLYLKDRHIHLDALRANNLHEAIFVSNYEYKSGRIEILLDTSSIEVFINDGKETITTRYYIHGDRFAATLRKCHDFVTKNIEVKEL